MLSLGKVCDTLQCLIKWEGITAMVSKDESGVYDDTLQDSINYLHLQTDYVVVNACLTKLILLVPFVDAPTVTRLREAGYQIDTKDIKTYVESINKSFRRAKNILNKLRSLEIKLKEVIQSPKEKRQVSLGDMISSVNVTLGGNYVDSYTPLEVYQNYKKMAKKKIELSKTAKHG